MVFKAESGRGGTQMKVLSTWVAQKYNLDSGLNLNKPPSQKTEAKWLEHKRHKYCNRKHINHKDSFSYKAQYYEKKVELLYKI